MAHEPGITCIQPATHAGHFQQNRKTLRSSPEATNKNPSSLTYPQRSQASVAKWCSRLHSRTSRSSLWRMSLPGVHWQPLVSQAEASPPGKFELALTSCQSLTKANPQTNSPPPKAPIGKRQKGHSPFVLGLNVENSKVPLTKTQPTNEPLDCRSDRPIAQPPNPPPSDAKYRSAPQAQRMPRLWSQRSSQRWQRHSKASRESTPLVSSSWYLLVVRGPC